MIRANDDAFPTDECGLSKREYFAAAILQGLLANPINGVKEYAVLSDLAVMLADNLIESLNTVPQPKDPTRG